MKKIFSTKGFQVFKWLCLMQVIFLCACAPTKNLKENEHLLRTAKIQLNTNRYGAEKGALRDQLDLLMAQRPNTYILGMFPYKLWLYNVRYRDYITDTANFQITSKTVELPTILDTSLIKETKENMKSLLVNQGFFYPQIATKISYKNKKAFLTYKINTNGSFLIDSNAVTCDNEDIRLLLIHNKDKSLFQRNTPYSNSLASEERNRIANFLKDYGYFNFTPENVFFVLDTLHTSHFHFDENLEKSMIDFFLNRKKHKPSTDIRTVIALGKDTLAFQKYRFNKVVVLPDYHDTSDFRSTDLITKTLDDVVYKYHRYYVSAKVLHQKILIRPGKEYAQKDYNSTISQLNDLGIFQYVRVRYFPNREDSTHQTLNCYILLGPTKKYDFNVGIEASGGNLYTLGTAASVSITNRNFLKGANQLSATVSYGLETSRNKALNKGFFKELYLFSQNAGLNFGLTFPKFILPWTYRPRSLPHYTAMNLGFNMLSRFNYFNLQTINASYGYIWHESKTQKWIVNPLVINTLNLSNVSDTFRQKLESIPAIANAYQKTFVEGESISYLFNNQLTHPRRYSYVRLGVEEAGLLMNGINTLSGGLGFNYANFVRFDFDARQYYKRLRSSVALRFYGGVGLPYGKSQTLPYIKQYFVGGAYSIRGWRPRVLGPGSYYDSVAQNSIDRLFIDQSGDIKLELNAEYRFAIVKLFSGAIGINGALFADAGNVWLAKPDSLMPGAHFQFKNLYQDIALSTGAGMRLDLGGFLVVRLDWAIPMKKPYVPTNNGWVIGDIDFGDKTWRKKNINFSMAIGYPF